MAKIAPTPRRAIRFPYEVETDAESFPVTYSGVRKTCERVGADEDDGDTEK